MFFWFLGVFLPRNLLGYFPRYLGVRQVRKMLGVLEVFLGNFRKDQGKDGQGTIFLF